MSLTHEFIAVYEANLAEYISENRLVVNQWVDSIRLALNTANAGVVDIIDPAERLHKYNKRIQSLSREVREAVEIARLFEALKQEHPNIPDFSDRRVSVMWGTQFNFRYDHKYYIITSHAIINYAVRICPDRLDRGDYEETIIDIDYSKASRYFKPVVEKYVTLLFSLLHCGMYAEQFPLEFDIGKFSAVFTMTRNSGWKRILFDLDDEVDITPLIHEYAEIINSMELIQSNLKMSD